MGNFLLDFLQYMAKTADSRCMLSCHELIHKYTYIFLILATPEMCQTTIAFNSRHVRYKHCSPPNTHRKMSSGYQHSIKVPTQYKRAAAVLKKALGREKSLKTLIYEEKHVRMRGFLNIINQYADNRGAIDAAIEQTKILEDNPRLCSYLCKVLVTELILGRKELNGDSRPVQTVRSYRDRLKEVLDGVTDSAKVTLARKKESKPRYVRVNSNVLTMDDVHAMLGQEEWRKKENLAFSSYDEFINAVKGLEEDEYMPDMHVDDVLIFHSKNKGYWAYHQYATEKKLLLQDKGTCLVGELLQPPCGSTVLDMCAAPGMKTIHVCNIMRNQGTIYAVEQCPQRYRLLCNMTRNAGCKIVQPINADALTVTVEQCPGVEYILVDPSCSGSGMQNRKSLEPEEKNPERLNKLAGLQIKMLSHAMTAFPDVKRIAYSTCSLYEEENEQVVRRCLELNPSFKLLNAKKGLRNKWRNVGSSEYKKIGKNCLYARPEDDLTDGIFIALFEKCRNNDENE